MSSLKPCSGVTAEFFLDNWIALIARMSRAFWVYNRIACWGNIECQMSRVVLQLQSAPGTGMRRVLMNHVK